MVGDDGVVEQPAVAKVGAGWLIVKPNRFGLIL
jgi:hypothetical protein